MYKTSKNTAKVVKKTLSEQKVLFSKQVLNLISEGIIITDIEGYITSCNSAALKLLGYNLIEELISLNIKDIISGKNNNPIDLTKIVSNSTDKTRLTFIRKNGETFLTDIRTTVLTDDNGIPISYVIITNNYLETTKLNEQLKLLGIALESISNEVLITDNSGEIIWSNSTFDNDKDFDNIEKIGKNPRIFQSGNHSDSFYKQLWDTI